MRKSVLMSVSAIAVIASAGIVTAQDKGGMGGGSGAAQAPQSTSPAQQSAPSAQPGGGEMRGGGETRGGTTGQGEPRGGSETKGGQTEQRMDQKGDRPQRTQDQRQQDQRQQDQRGAQDQQMNQRENRAQDKSDKKGAADTKSQRDSTTGQGAAGSSGGASLTTEQRTKISTTIKQTNVRPATNVNFNVSVGTVVPRDVTLHALPPTVVEVYPQWRSYRFILVGDEIVIIEPDTLRIVAVIDA